MYRHWSFGKRSYRLGEFPLLMGIVNITPDSFSDGGLFYDAQNLDPGRAVEQALKLVEQGADFLDLGAESTRPGAEPVSLKEELKRIVPVVEQLAAQTEIPLSIDTTKAEVARECLQAGAEIINDISGLTFDAEMPEVCREFKAGIVCMHIKGTPRTMQDSPVYEDCIAEIKEWLDERLVCLMQIGIPHESIVLDPGIGFGKTAEHNLTILSSIKEIREAGRPVLIGHSRKRFLGSILGRNHDERLAGTIGVSIALAQQETDILRVHDVAAVSDALKSWRAICCRVSDR